MRKLLMLAALAAALVATPAVAQNSDSTPASLVRPTDRQKTGTVTAASTCGTTGFAGGTSCVEHYASGMGSALVTLTGSFTATMAFQVMDASGTWVSAQAIPFGGGVPVTSATAVGSWVVSLVGNRGIRLNCTAFTSTPTISIESTAAQFLATATAAALAAQDGTQGQLATRPGEWSVIHQPAAATAAVSQKAAGSGTVRHVATSCSVYISTVAAQPDIVVNLRDGATGAGTIIWTGRLSCAITSGNACSATSPRLNITGTAATAMTCETATAPAATNIAVATLTGYDVR